MIGEDDRRGAAMFGEMFGRVLCPDVSKQETGRRDGLMSETYKGSARKTS